MISDFPNYSILTACASVMEFRQGVYAHNRSELAAGPILYAAD
jgi:hypothetical protein